MDEHGEELIPLEVAEGSGAREIPEAQQPVIKAPGAGTSESCRPPRPVVVGDPEDAPAEPERARAGRATLKKAGPENRRHSNVPIGAPDIPEEDGQPDSLTRRRVTRKTAPLPDPALAKMHEKLNNEKELYRLHLKHYHMPLDQLKRRTKIGRAHV